MKEVIKYVADDGREFQDMKSCLLHESRTRFILNMVKSHENDPVEALVALMDGVQDILGIRIVGYDGYVRLFRNHKPCHYACSLWRQLIDYIEDHPSVYNAYYDYMNRYISLYGEFGK